MSQSDIFELLKNKYLSGDLKYYSSEDIRKLLLSKGTIINRASINNNLLKLRVFGYLDCKMSSKKYKGRVIRPFIVYRLRRESLE
jgi:hypothetical protein